MAIEFALMLPWFVVLYHVRNNTAGTDSGSPLVAGVYSIFAFVFSYSLGPSVRELHQHFTMSAPELAELAAAAVVGCGIAFAIWQSRRNRSLQQIMIIAGTPLILAAAITSVTSVALNARYVSIVSIPVVCLIAASLQQQWKSRAMRASAAGLAILSVLSFVQYRTLPKYERDDYRSAVHYIDNRYNGEPVYTLTYPAPVEVYSGSRFQPISLAADSIGQRNLDRLRASNYAGGAAWVIEARPWEISDLNSRLNTVVGTGRIADQAKYPGVTVMRIAKS